MESVQTSTTITGTSTTSVVSSYEGEQRKPKGAVLFTGPDGVGDHRVAVVEHPQYIGHTTASPEATGDVSYMCRPAQGCPAPPPKTAGVGEVGWGIPRYTDYSLLKTGHQIQLKEFRQANEERYTHRFQNPYYQESLLEQDSGHSMPAERTAKDNTLLSVQTERDGGSSKTSTVSVLSQTKD